MPPIRRSPAASPASARPAPLSLSASVRDLRLLASEQSRQIELLRAELRAQSAILAELRELARAGGVRPVTATVPASTPPMLRGES